MNIQLSRISRNTKTGPIPTSISPSNTCPDTCHLKGAGCYAENFPLKLHWNRVDNGIGHDWSSFCDEISRFPRGQLWRYGQAGDLPGLGNEIDPADMFELIKANKGRRGFSYTHKPMTDRNQTLVYMANHQGFTVNLSADSLKEADDLAALEVAPVVVALPHTQKCNTRTPEGRKVLICPNHFDKRVNCQNCELCAIPDRSAIIGFPAHGNRKEQATAALMRCARDR